MIFIWGSRHLKSTRDTGRFYCPHCVKLDVAYQHQSAREWFTLYFIPVFPIGGHKEYIECLKCKNTYTTEVLELKPPSDDDLFVRDCYDRLQQGDSLEDVEAALVKSGRTGAQALELVDELTQGKVRQCDRCEVHYLKTVKRCRACEGRRL